MFDLRLLGISSRIPVSDLARHLLPWSRAGLLLVAPTGIAMFAAHATEWIGNPAFGVKLSLIAAAGLNAWVFHRWTFPSVAAWDRHAPAPASARASAVASLLLWTGVVSCGRLLAYL
jgi:hypothetical protein